MSGLVYVGRQRDSDLSVFNKEGMDVRIAEVAANQAYVDAKVADRVTTLALKTYVDSQDATLAKKTAVDTADGTYLLGTTRGAANGVPSIGSDGFVPAAQVPSGVGGFMPKVYTGTKLQASNLTTTDTNSKSGLVARVTVPILSYPWQVLCFGQMRGYSPTSAYGQLNVYDGKYNNLLATTLTAPTTQERGYNLAPVTTLASPWVFDGTEQILLNMYAAVFNGTNFVWSVDTSGFFFTALVLPASTS